VQYVVVLECADDVHDRVRLANGGEELVAQAFALRCALHQTRDVDELHRGRHHALRLDDAFEHRKARVRDIDSAHVGVFRREWIVRGQHVGRRQCIEQRRFADVRQADDSEFEHRRGMS
jgi:hypothetical protein